MSYSLGIDLGTTYTAAAIARRGRAEVATLSYRTTSIPTVVALTEDGTFVVGDPAERHAATNPERLAREFKRRVGDPTPLLLGGTPVSVDRLLAEMIGFIHRTVAQTEGEPPASTVVTHPANWGPFKRDVLVQALRLAGLEGAGLLPEPVAAATWYARAERLAPGATVAVYDLGGGTFDTVVLEMGRDGAFAVRGRPEGIERLGGVDVDAAVLGHVLRVTGIGAGAVDTGDPATLVAMARLRRDCVEAKEALSSETSVSIPVPMPAVRDQVLLPRRELEELIGPLLAPTMGALARTVASAGLRPGQPDAVLLIGGASRTPLVAREVGMALGRPVAIDAHPKHPVALGAALVAEARAPREDRAPAAARVAVPAAVPGEGGAGTPSPASAPEPPTVAEGTVPAPPRWGAPPGQPGPPGPQRPPGHPGPPTRPSPPGPPPGPRPPGRPGRARLLAAGAAAVVVALAVGLLLRGGGDGDDPAGGGTAGTGDATESTPGTDAEAEPTGGAHLAWTVDLSEETAGAPVTDGQRAFIEDSTGRLTAIDMASGTVAWAAVIGSEASNVTPVLAGDLVLASATEPDVIQALDAATGAVRWTVPDRWFYEQPVVIGDSVVVQTGFEAFAYGLADGAERWHATFDDDNLWTGLVPAGDVLVAGTSGGHLVGLDPGSGEVIFRTPMPRGDKTIWSVAVVGGTVLAYDDDSYVTGVSPASGEMLWTLDAEATFPGSFAALGADAVVWLDSGELLVLDPATGTERRRLPGGSNAMHVLPGEPPLLVVAEPGSLRALAPDATEAWSAELPLLGQHVASGGGALIVSDFEGNVAGYRVAA
jgi:outer membrane protein assembly factor BamB